MVQASSKSYREAGTEVLGTLRILQEEATSAKCEMHTLLGAMWRCVRLISDAPTTTIQKRLRLNLTRW